MEKSATLHYINQASIPRDCDVAPQILLYPSSNRYPAVSSPNK